MASPAPSPLNPQDPNYSGTPYVVNLPAYSGDIAQCLAAMQSLQLSIMLEGPKPNYSVHGENYDWQSLMDYFDRSIELLQRRLVRANPWERISRGL